MKIGLSKLLFLVKQNYLQWFRLNAVGQETQLEILLEKISYYEIFLNEINLNKEFLVWHRSRQVIIAKEKEHIEAKLEGLARELGI